jgi:3-isopropylmalate/(R)-2-methylmalate dehydratase small subunit
MERFHHHRGVVAALPKRNIDTDQIIPARFLHRARSEGYGQQLFHDLRVQMDGSENASFVLNQPPYRGATVLVAQENFGCGSSREHAVWALVDFGFKVIIAPSFGDIFYNNALQNGLLVIRLDQTAVDAITRQAEQEPATEIEIDLANQTVAGCGVKASFDIDPYRKEALMLGLSEIEMTLRNRSEIEQFESRHVRTSPWLQAPLPRRSASTI